MTGSEWHTDEDVFVKAKINELYHPLTEKKTWRSHFQAFKYTSNFQWKEPLKRDCDLKIK